VTPDHTAWARGILGPDALLCPEQKLLLETDTDTARRIARSHTGTYTGLANYQNNLKQFGFGAADFENNGSDKLVDAIVGWGDESALRARVQAHWDAGANHVCIQALKDEVERGPSMALLELMAPLNR
jgi:probable F420-dependent oxidoreductase